MQILSKPIGRCLGVAVLTTAALLQLAASASATPAISNTARRAYSKAMVPPGVPTVSDRHRRLRERGLQAGSPMLVRIFKSESELEVWMLKDDRYELFSTYPICYWSGKLGPKQREGDRQSAEGFYSVSRPQLHRHGRWKRALDLGYPNAFDRANQRTGSAILVHGGCGSIGCYAMTNPLMEEIFVLSEAALDAGQTAIPIHVFPFRMTEENLAAQKNHPWASFWANLKQAYDSFERTRQPPHVAVCGPKYLVRDANEDSGAPATPRRMVKLVRMMRGDFPLQPGECAQDATATPQIIAAASRVAHELRASEVPETPLATLPIPPRPVPVVREAPETPVATLPVPPRPVPAVRSVRAIQATERP